MDPLRSAACWLSAEAASDSKYDGLVKSVAKVSRAEEVLGGTSGHVRLGSDAKKIAARAISVLGNE